MNELNKLSLEEKELNRKLLHHLQQITSGSKRFMIDYLPGYVRKIPSQGYFRR